MRARIFSYLSRQRLFFIFVFLILLINWAGSLFPYFNYFSFEFAVLNSLILTITSGVLYLIGNNYELRADNFLRKLYLNLILISLPLLFAWINSFFVDNCLSLHGLIYYFIIAMPAVIVGFGIAAFSNLFQYKYLTFIFCFFVLLFGWIPEILFNPQIYFYNPVIVFFPGTIYDDYIPIDSKMILYRSMNIIFALFVIVIDKRLRNNGFVRNKILLFTVTVLVYVISFFIYPFFGFSTSHGQLESAAESSFKYGNIRFYVYEKVTNEEIRFLMGSGDYYLRQQSKFFGTRSSSEVNVYLFTDNEQKREFFGTANADVAKPWMNSVFLTMDSYYENLEHELAHVSAAGLTDNFLGIPPGFDFSLIEGMAVAEGGEYDLRNINFLASQYLMNDSVLNGSKNYNIDFFNLSSTAGYIISGAFLLYLKDNYGREALRKLYQTGDYHLAYSRSSRELFVDFSLSLQSGNFRYDSTLSKYYFNRKSTLKKYCPRLISYKYREAAGLIREKKYDESLFIYSEIYNLSSESRAQYLKALLLQRLKRYDKMVEVVSSILKNGSGGFLEPYYELILFDGKYLLGALTDNQIDSALSVLSLNVPNYTFREEIQLRVVLMRAGLLREYLKSDLKSRSSVLVAALEKERNITVLSKLISLEDMITDLPEVSEHASYSFTNGVLLNLGTIANIAAFHEKKMHLKEALQWLNSGLKECLPEEKLIYFKRIERITEISKNFKN